MKLFSSFIFPEREASPFVRVTWLLLIVQLPPEIVNPSVSLLEDDEFGTLILYILFFEIVPLDPVPETLIDVIAPKLALDCIRL